MSVSAALVGLQHSGKASKTHLLQHSSSTPEPREYLPPPACASQESFHLKYSPQNIRIEFILVSSLKTRTILFSNFFQKPGVAGLLSKEDGMLFPFSPSLIHKISSDSNVTSPRPVSYD